MRPGLVGERQSDHTSMVFTPRGKGSGLDSSEMARPIHQPEPRDPPLSIYTVFIGNPLMATSHTLSGFLVSWWGRLQTIQ